LQARKSLSIGKVTNLVEGVETWIWFEKMQLMLSTIVKLPFLMSKKSMFGNNKIRTSSTLSRQDIAKKRKRWNNDHHWYWEEVLELNIS
jgi:hypothetical protein